jgi:hypothetical protein
MSAAQALGAARAFGIQIELDGDDLLLHGHPHDVFPISCGQSHSRSFCETSRGRCPPA